MNSGREDVVAQIFPQSALYKDKLRGAFYYFDPNKKEEWVGPKGEAQSALLSKVPRHFNPDAGLHFATFDLEPVCINGTVQVTNAAHSKIVSAHLLEEREFKFAKVPPVSGEEGSVSLALFQLAQHALYSNFLSRKVYQDLLREWCLVSQEAVDQSHKLSGTNAVVVAQVIKKYKFYQSYFVMSEIKNILSSLATFLLFFK